MVQGHNTYIAGGSKGFTSGGTRAKTSDLSALTAGGIGLPTSRGSGGFIAGVRDGPVVSEEKKKKEREKLDRERVRVEESDLIFPGQDSDDDEICVDVDVHLSSIVDTGKGVDLRG